ncbi:MAG: hypothetical protein ABMA01_10955 [Chthoniobacteraceae bacterium]
MKLHSLISAVVLGMAVLVQAQTSPAPQASRPALKFTDESGTLITDTLILKAGPLTEVVAQVERQVKENPKQPNGFLPNLVYAKDIRDAVVPGDLILRGVTPVQALALVAAAADCTFRPIFAPDEKAGQKTVIIGYRIESPSAGNVSGYAMPRPAISGLSGMAEEGSAGGIGITLTKTEGGVAVGHASPGSPASQVPAIRPGRLIVSVAEAGKPDVDVTGLELEKVMQLIRGQPGTPVKITLAPDSDKGLARETVQLVRVKLPQLNTVGSPFGSSGGSSGPSGSSSGSSQARPKVEVVYVAPPGGMLPGISLTRVPKNSFPDHPGNPPGMAVENNQPFVRVYAIGFVNSGSDTERRDKVKSLDELIGQALGQAKLNPNPDINFHVNTGALIAKATAAQHEIIEQVVQVMKENATQPAATAKP